MDPNITAHPGKANTWRMKKGLINPQRNKTKNVLGKVIKCFL